MSWINVCDVPFDGSYKLSIIKGLFTMFMVFFVGVFVGYKIRGLKIRRESGGKNNER